jgi:hypothetical protein
VAQTLGAKPITVKLGPSTYRYEDKLIGVNIYERTIALDESHTIDNKKRIRIIIINHLLYIGEEDRRKNTKELGI